MEIIICLRWETIDYTIIETCTFSQLKDKHDDSIYNPELKYFLLQGKNIAIHYIFVNERKNIMEKKD